MVAHLGVHGIGKVERCRTGTQDLHLSLGGEDKDLALEQVDLKGLEELLGVRQIVLLGPVEGAAQPGQLVVEPLGIACLVALGVAGLLVEPVGGDAVFGVLVHLLGTDLNLEGATCRTDDRGVQ